MPQNVSDPGRLDASHTPARGNSPSRSPPPAPPATTRPPQIQKNLSAQASGGADASAPAASSVHCSKNASIACASSGRANRKPWPLSQCSSCSSDSSLLSARCPRRTSRSRAPCRAAPACGSASRPPGCCVSRGDERAVDLQRVDREPLQVCQRGVAGAEVVDRDAHAELLDRAPAAARSPRRCASASSR